MNYVMVDNVTWALAESEEYEELKQAAIEGDVQRLKAALEPNLDVNAFYGVGFEGWTILHEVACRGHLDAIRYLLAHGANIDVCYGGEHGGGTPLCYAARGAHVQAVQVLLEAGATIEVTGDGDENVLTAVLGYSGSVQVEQSHIDMITLLLDHGLDVNAKVNSWGPTILQQAIKAGDNQLIKVLLDRGASLESNSHFEALATAAEWNSNRDTVKFLIDRGAKDTNSHAICGAARHNKIDMARALLLNAPGSIPAGKSGPLHNAALMGYLDMVNLLLDNNFDVNLPGLRAVTPLHAACSADAPSLEVVQVLLDSGADTAARCEQASGYNCRAGDTPLHTAAWHSDPGIVHLLLSAGADITSRNDVDETPLITFARVLTKFSVRTVGANPRMVTLQMLLEAGSDPNARAVNGRTALHWLASTHYDDQEKNKLNGAKMLLSRGADPTLLDKEGRTAAQLVPVSPRFVEFKQVLDNATTYWLNTHT